ncbi:MAG: DUF4179 domain-containing protein, partial [Anaerolineales bacterium]|nr:DUF4179 domain-containing protein [Anaerolineales bacterium]
MNKQQFQQTLHELAAQAIPSNLDLWPVIRARVAHKSHRTLWMRMLPATRLGWASLALVASFVFGVTAYAAAPVISRLLQMDEQLKYADPASLGQPFDLSQTIDNVTVTMQWAYADADRVLVGYTVRSSDGRRFDPYDATLTEATGIAFQWQGGYGVTGQSDVLQVTLPPGEGTFIEIFDNILGLSTVSRTLNVHFTVYAQELV